MSKVDNYIVSVGLTVLENLQNCPQLDELLPLRRSVHNCYGLFFIRLAILNSTVIMIKSYPHFSLFSQVLTQLQQLQKGCTIFMFFNHLLHHCKCMSCFCTISSGILTILRVLIIALFVNLDQFKQTRLVSYFFTSRYHF